MELNELVLKCINGIYKGSFFYINSLVKHIQEPEIIGSGSYESHKVTMSMQDSGLEPVHGTINYRNEYYMTAAVAQTTWIKLNSDFEYIINPNQCFKIGNCTVLVIEIDNVLPSLTLKLGNTELRISGHFVISSKQPADYVFPSLEKFWMEIEYISNSFRIKNAQGKVYHELVQEVKMAPGLEFSIGTLDFEACRYNYGRWGDIGLRSAMEDSDIIIQNLFISDFFVSYYAIFDGHGGNKCSEYLKENLHKILKKNLQGNSNINNWPDIIKESFIECDQNFHLSFYEISKVMGSTGLVCLLTPGCLIVANTGDSRAILSRRGQAIQLTNDHKPDLPSEKSRILSNGGSVTLGRVMGKLSLSRAFGDYEFKLPGKKIITCVPEIDLYQINRNIDDFIVLGCDGLFEAYSNQDVVEFVRDRLRRMKVTEQDPCRVVKDLVSQAVYAQKTRDNVSAILITLLLEIKNDNSTLIESITRKKY